jgi:hypothetical protein
MMDVSLMISDIANFRMNIFALDASFFPHSDIMSRYDNAFYVARTHPVKRSDHMPMELAQSYLIVIMQNT